MDDTSVSRPRITPLRILGGLVLLGSFGIWAYAFSGSAVRDAPNTLDEPTFAARAEPICAPVLAAILELPRAETAATAAERTAVLNEATNLLEPMVERLSAEVTGSDEDIEILAEWLGDWDAYLQARRDFADALRIDPTSRFLLPEKGPRAVSAAIDNLAIVNQMPSCGNPGDVG